MKKRGQAYQIFFIAELIISILVSFLLIQIAIDYAKGDAITKSYLAGDTALIINTLNSLPGNLMVFYPTVNFDYILKFKDNQVTVLQKEPDQFDKTAGIYPFIPTVQQHIDYRFDKPKNLIFHKVGHDIIITDSELLNLNQLACPKISTAVLRNIVIDPGHGSNQEFSASAEEEDYGLVNDVLGLEESDITRQIAESLYIMNNNLIATRDIRFEEFKSIDERLSIINNKNIDSVISIHVGSNPNPEINNVKARISSESIMRQQSRRLACLILNSLSTELSTIKGLSIIPVNVSELKKDDPMRILDTDKVAVYLEIGNIMINQKNLLQKIPEISKAINDGIKKYNG
jgi:N-acetylmuramoyl-L-alanine amidase